MAGRFSFSVPERRNASDPWFRVGQVDVGTTVLVIGLCVASMFVWARYPETWRKRLNSIDFSMKLLEEAEVAVSPGRGFGELGEGYLRLALVENEQRLRQAVRQIARCLRAEEVVTGEKR